MQMAEDNWPWLLQGDPTSSLLSYSQLKVGMAEREAEENKNHQSHPLQTVHPRKFLSNC